MATPARVADVAAQVATLAEGQAALQQQFSQFMAVVAGQSDSTPVVVAKTAPKVAWEVRVTPKTDNRGKGMAYIIVKVDEEGTAFKTGGYLRDKDALQHLAETIADLL
jgi:hypothetical protein